MLLHYFLTIFSIYSIRSALYVMMDRVPKTRVSGFGSTMEKWVYGKDGEKTCKTCL